MPNVETTTPPDTPTPIGPYNHIANVDRFVTTGGTAGLDPTVIGVSELPKPGVRLTMNLTAVTRD